MPPSKSIRSVPYSNQQIKSFVSHADGVILDRPTANVVVSPPSRLSHLVDGQIPQAEFVLVFYDPILAPVSIVPHKTDVTRRSLKDNTGEGDLINWHTVE